MATNLTVNGQTFPFPTGNDVGWSRDLTNWAAAASSAIANPMTINVRSYGAKGDGVTNDGPSIRLALTALADSGGGTLYFPAGTYIARQANTAVFGATATITSSNIRITGDGVSSVIYNDVIVAGTNETSFIFSIAQNNTTTNNIEIDHVTLKSAGNRDDTSGYGLIYVAGIGAATCTGLRIHHCAFETDSLVGVSMGIVTINDVWITDNIFNGTESTGIYLAPGAGGGNRVRIARNIFNSPDPAVGHNPGNGSIAIAIRRGIDVEVTGNYIQNYTLAGIALRDGNPTRINIHHNEIRNMTHTGAAGIICLGGRDSRIVNNNIDTCDGNGIYALANFNQIDNLIIEGNKVRNTGTSYAILVGPYAGQSPLNPQIIGNSCIEGASGISLDSPAGMARIIDNNIYRASNNSNNGIAIANVGAAKVSVEDNKVDGHTNGYTGNVIDSAAYYKGNRFQSTISDTTASPGSATAHDQEGKSAIASGASACTVTTKFCNASSHVAVEQIDLDATLTAWKVAPGGGSFTVTGNTNATSTWKFKWKIN